MTDTSTLPLAEVRALFPYTESQIYLNHASISPLSRPVQAALDHYLRERHGERIENFFPTLMDAMSRLRARLTTLIHAEGPEQIALVSNTSHGLNLLASGIAWQPGDRILLNTLEFPANVYPFLNLAAQGVIIDWVQPRGHYLALEDFAAALQPRTRLVSVSQVQFLSGQYMPLAELSALCQQHGSYFCVDGIQGLGATDLDVQALGIDCLVAGGHKWLMGLEGQGFAYFSPRLLQVLQQPQVGWLSVEDAWNMLDYRLQLRADAARFELGTPNAAGIVALEAALEVFARWPMAAITAHILHLSQLLCEGLSERGFALLTPAETAERLGIVTCDAPEAEALQQGLAAAGITTSFREGRYLRFAPHFYNSPEEIGQMFRQLDALRA